MLLIYVLSRNQMAEMHRVETPAKETYFHAIPTVSEQTRPGKAAFQALRI